MPFESSITGSIIDYLNSLPGGRAEKLKGSSSGSGKADVNGCYRGRSLRIEVKTPDNRNEASKKQEHNLEKWEKAGAVTMVAYSKESVERLIAALDKGFKGKLTVNETNGCISWAKVPELKLKG